MLPRGAAFIIVILVIIACTMALVIECYLLSAKNWLHLIHREHMFGTILLLSIVAHTAFMSGLVTAFTTVSGMVYDKHPDWMDESWSTMVASFTTLGSQFVLMQQILRAMNSKTALGVLRSEELSHQKAVLFDAQSRSVLQLLKDKNYSHPVHQDLVAIVAAIRDGRNWDTLRTFLVFILLFVPSVVILFTSAFQSSSSGTTHAPLLACIISILAFAEPTIARVLSIILIKELEAFEHEKIKASPLSMDKRARGERGINFVSSISGADLFG